MEQQFSLSFYLKLTGLHYQNTNQDDKCEINVILSMSIYWSVGYDKTKSSLPISALFSLPVSVDFYWVEVTRILILNSVSDDYWNWSSRHVLKHG